MKKKIDFLLISKKTLGNLKTLPTEKKVEGFGQESINKLKNKIKERAYQKCSKKKEDKINKNNETKRKRKFN